MEIKALEVVALPENQPGKGLVRGQVGTVVETLAPGVFEIEFSDNDGRTYATVALKASKPRTRSRGLRLVAGYFLRFRCFCAKSGCGIFSGVVPINRRTMRILSQPRFCAAAAWIIGAVVGLPVLCNSALGQSDAPAIDHVRVLVHDIAAAQNTLHALGFEMRWPEPSVYQEGSAHNSAPFSDGTYLELIGIAEREKLLKSRPWIVDFLQLYQGAHSVGIIVTTAKDVADRLQSQGIDAPLFTLRGSNPEAKPFLLITPKLANIPDGAIFFLEYPWKRSSSAQLSQPNTAQGTVAVWILVKDLEKAGKGMERIGFHSGRLLKFDVMGARGREFDIGDGRILLLESDSPGKSAADSSRERGEGVMGLTLRVGDLGKAKSLIEENTHRKLASYDGIYGKSFLVPAEIANGVWIEMAQK